MTIGGVDLSAAATKVSQSLAANSAATNRIHAMSTKATGASSGAGSSSSASAAGAKQITSSDFLTLLVTEMKNQDPTQPTDPNAYIQQLVGVNSLQQLISINQELTPSTPPVPATTALSSPAFP